MTFKCEKFTECNEYYLMNNAYNLNTIRLSKAEQFNDLKSAFVYNTALRSLNTFYFI